MVASFVLAALAPLPGACGGDLEGPGKVADAGMDLEPEALEARDSDAETMFDADSSGIEAAGCDADVLNDPDNCGSCGNACPPVHGATSACSGGSCTMGKCDPGFADCDLNSANGCEALLLTDVQHCGACWSPCPGGTQATPACVAGVCKLFCSVGYKDCNLSNADGCEVNVNSDPKNCGFCLWACSASQTCKSGKCV